jgi:nitrogenase molybdenum-iron protein alpha/beta subunit
MKKIILAGGLFIIVLVIAIAALPGCSKEEQTENKKAVSGEDVKKETKEAYDTTKEYTREQIQDFRDKMATELDEYGKKIDVLQAKTEELGGDAKKEINQELAEMRQKYADAYDSLNELKNSGSDEWAQLKSEVDSAMEGLSNVYKKASDEFLKPIEGGDN